MGFINISRLKLEYGIHGSAEFEIIHLDNEDLRINIHDRDQTMLTRIELAVEKDTVILKLWKPEKWTDKLPHKEIILGKL